MTRSFNVAITALLVLVTGCGHPASVPVTAKPAAAPTSQRDADDSFALDESSEVPQRLNAEHLPNVYRITQTVLSGGLPEGDDAFQELADLGVKTIISVDGMKPDVAAARRHGLRYVHLPHGYDGVPEARALELAKAVRDLPGPVYIHCHHGHHRSPTAAAVACVGAGLIDRSLAVRILTTAGTSEHYRGLYASAEQAHPFDQALLDALQPEFPEISPVPPLADAMVALEQTHVHLQELAAAGWKPLPENPDLEPAHEALLLREQFMELQRLNDVTRQPEEFRASLHDSERAARRLEDALRAAPVDSARARSQLDLIGRNCTACHRTFRDTPLDEKAR